MRASAGWILIAPLMAALVACGGDGNGITDTDDDDDDVTGSFEVTFNGAISGTFEGLAQFGSQQGAGFALSLIGDNGSTVISLARYVQGRPGTGTYTIVDVNGNPQDGQFILTGASGNVAFGATTGTLTITASSSSRVAGTIDFDGDTSVGQVSADVTFSARCSQFSALQCD